MDLYTIKNNYYCGLVFRDKYGKAWGITSINVYKEPFVEEQRTEYTIANGVEKYIVNEDLLNLIYLEPVRKELYITSNDDYFQNPDIIFYNDVRFIKE